MEELLKLWCPINKTPNGEFIGILSDTSIDRDEEMMDKSLLKEWANNKTLPMLVDHKNSMEKFVGGWKDITFIEKGENGAITAVPMFFSEDAEPLAAQMKKKIDEALDMGLNPGISIGAIPKDHIYREVKGKKIKVYTKAELVEGTIVPVQSNRGATFLQIAKEFNLEDKKMEEISVDKAEHAELTKPKELEDCVKSIMADPEFKPQDGKTKEESAYAVCQSKMKAALIVEAAKINIELEKATDEKETLKKELESLKVEIAEKAKLIEELRSQNVKKNEKELAVLKTTDVAPMVQKQTEVEPTVQNMLKQIYGGK